MEDLDPVAGVGAVGGVEAVLVGVAVAQRADRDPDPGELDRLAEARSELIESVIEESEDESLMDRYLSGEVIDQKVLIEDLEKAVERGSF